MGTLRLGSSAVVPVLNTRDVCVVHGVDSNGKLVGGTTAYLNNINSIGERGLYMAFTYSQVLSPDVTFLRGIQTIDGSMALYQCFHSSAIRSLDLSSLVSINGQAAVASMVDNTALQSIDLSNLTSIFSSGVTHGAYFMLAGTTYLTSVHFPSLSVLSGTRTLSYCFCRSGVQDIYFEALTSTSFGEYTDHFYDMLTNNTGTCTVHFPVNLESVIGNWSDVINGFGGTNVTVAFDLSPTA